MVSEGDPTLMAFLIRGLHADLSKPTSNSWMFPQAFNLTTVWYCVGWWISVIGDIIMSLIPTLVWITPNLISLDSSHVISREVCTIAYFGQFC